MCLLSSALLRPIMTGTRFGNVLSPTLLKPPKSTAPSSSVRYWYVLGRCRRMLRREAESVPKMITLRCSVSSGSSFVLGEDGEVEDELVEEEEDEVGEEASVGEAEALVSFPRAASVGSSVPASAVTWLFGRWLGGDPGPWL